MKKRIMFLITVMLTLGTSVFAVENTKVFTDIDSSHWAYSAVNQMVKDGVVNGYEDGTFRPDQEITRAEFAKIFSEALDVDYRKENDGTGLFMQNVDSSHWAYSYIESAYVYFPPDNNYSVSFEPDEYITREDAAYIIARRLLPDVSTYGALDRFSDANDVTYIKKERVSLAVASGIMNGHEDGRLDPKGSLTRAQVCTLFNNVKYKSDVYREYWKFGEVLKCITITTNLNGKEKNKVDVEMIFDVPTITSIDISVLNSGEEIEPKLVFEKTKNELYKDMESVKFSFYIEPESFYYIRIYDLRTADGKITHDTSVMDIINPNARLKVKYDGEIDKDTNIEFEWNSIFFEIPSKKIEWYLVRKNISGQIDDYKFSVEDDIIKTTKETLPRKLDVTFVANDDTYYGDFQRIYKYNIFDISNKKTNTNKDDDIQKDNKNDKVEENLYADEKDPREELLDVEKIEKIVSLGIMAKYENNTFRPSIKPNGHEAVMYVVNLMNYSVTAKVSQGKYKKMDADQIANGYFYIADQENFFMNLNEDKFIAGEENITRAEFVALVLNAMGYYSNMRQNGNITQYWAKAYDIGLFDGMKDELINDKDAIITREFVCNVLYIALDLPIWERIETSGAVYYNESDKTLYEIKFENDTTSNNDNKEIESKPYIDIDIQNEKPTNQEIVDYVVLIMNFNDADKLNNAQGKYKKLASAHWANGAFYIASQEGYFMNLDEEKFIVEESSVTCQEFVSLVLNAMGYAPAILGGGENQYWMQAVDLGMFEGMQLSKINRNSVVTSEFVSDILENAMNIPIYEKIESNKGITYKQSEKTLYEIIYK